MSNVIRVKRNLDALDETPATLVVKRVKKSATATSEAEADLVFKFHHSTETSHLEDDPKLMIPQVMASKPKANARLIASNHGSLNSTIERPRFKVVSQNRMRTANGSELKVMDLAKESPVDDEDQLPPAVRAMMEEYSKQNAMDTSESVGTDNFVYDVYFLDEKAATRNTFDANGAVSIELEEEDALYFEDNNDNEDCVEDDEDSNAEDDYRNEYPDSEEDGGMDSDW
ncbi:hypothetical protein BDR26DRAFT_1006970 [Obelidium mucronatum]|nr:hypothetical protein BDR26DRAFT_1006970 [Obelidium mucronatum]